MSTVIVTWMDRLQETYPADRVEFDHAQLHIVKKRRGSARPETLHIPLANVRIWLEER